MAADFVSGFVVSSLLQELVDKILGAAADTISLVYQSDIEMELKNLEANYVKAQAMLGTIDGWGLIVSKAQRDWVADVRRACYDTEDFIKLLKLEILSKMEDARLLSSFFKKWGISRRLRNLQCNLDRSINEADFHHNHGCTASRQHITDVDVNAALLDAASFRRKKNKDSLVGFFLHPSTSSSSWRSRIAVIWGMFGVGKTTLAQVVKNDPRLENHFDHRLWVSVWGDFDLVKALNSMIIDLQEEQTQELCPRPPFPSLQSELSWTIRMFHALCKEKRVLVVLDDLCSFARPQDWENFKSLLDPSCTFGIIVTTRNPKIASMVSSSSSFSTLSHHLQTLSNEDCASLILSKADSVNSNNPAKRKSCGKTIVEMEALQIAEKCCKGLPLVADIFGHRLLYEPEFKWATIDLWDMPEFRDQIFPTFRLNYSDLSIFLKHCLPYFSLFPENYNFSKNELIRLWMAEGFIRPQVTGVHHFGYTGLEQLGRYAFDEVLSRSILQIYSPFNQEPQVYRMHEFIRRYAQYIGSDMYARIDQQFVPSGTDCSVTSANMATQLRKARHISFLCPIPPEMWKDIEKCEGLRTILSPHMGASKIEISQLKYTLFLKLQWLRVLMLRRTDIKELPESLGKLKHLGLLDVSETDIKKLPRSTVHLYGLQVLRLDDCDLLLWLPTDIKNLTQLLHLEVDIKGLTSMPPHIGELRNLRTLRAFIVDRKDGHRITELKNMKYLEGSICLTNLENVKDETEAKEAMLGNKPFLKRVELEWNGYLDDQSLPESVLAGFEPHKNLEELKLVEYGGARFPNWLSSPECGLTGIHFENCHGCSTLPALGQLEHLKTLHLQAMYGIKYIDHQIYGTGVSAGFPSLELLKFEDMMSLEKWDGLQADRMPRLRDLVIIDCERLCQRKTCPCHLKN